MGITLSIFFFLACFALPQQDAALAATGPSANGMGTNNPPLVLTADEKALLAEKQALVNEFSLMRQGNASQATFIADWGRFKLNHHLSHGASVMGSISPSLSSAAVVSMLPAITLNITQEPQFQPYYCGPAAVEEMLLGMGFPIGPHGENLNAASFPSAGQVVLANNTYLQTDSNPDPKLRGTNWSAGPGGTVHVVPATLNAWIHSNFYVPVNASTMSIASYENDIIFDIANGFPVAAGIHEDVNTPHLTGHGGQFLTTLNHWIAIRGYTASGGMTTYNDSIHGVPSGWGWTPPPPAPQIPATSTVSSGGIIWPLIQPFGIVA